MENEQPQRGRQSIFGGYREPVRPSGDVLRALVPHSGQRSIFIGHVNADDALASSLRTLLQQALGESVQVVTSSDLAPIAAERASDDTWYWEAQARLMSAESICVLATNASVGDPWLYWQAATAYAVRPSNVLVLRVKLLPERLPVPLAYLPSYDGLAVGDDGVDTMVKRLGAHLAIELDEVLVATCTSAWLETAKAYEPQQLTPLRQAVLLDGIHRLEAGIVRIERALEDLAERIGSLRRAPLTSNPPAPSPSFRLDRMGVIHSPAVLVKLFELFPVHTIEVSGPGLHNDILIALRSDIGTLFGWLAPQAIMGSPTDPATPEPLRTAFETARALLKQRGIAEPMGQ